MPDDIVIRPARAGEWFEIKWFAAGSWFEGYLEWPSPEHIESMFGPLEQVLAESTKDESKTPFFLLATDANDKIVGMFDGSTDKDKGTEVLRGNYAIVSPARRGEGIATDLLEELKRLGAAAGFNMLRVEPVTPTGVQQAAKWGFRDEITGAEPQYLQFAVMDL